MKRNYQDIIFKDMDSVSVDYIPADPASSVPARQALIYTPKGDIQTRRAFVIGLHPGGSDLTTMKQWASDYTSRGYVYASIDYGETGGDFDLNAQIAAIVNTGCFLRWAHVNRDKYGIAGGKIFIHGVSAGGITAWQTNISLPLTDPMFKSTINDLYKKTKMKLLGSASMPGGVNDTIVKLINSGNVVHNDSHGDKDPILPLSKSQAAVDQSNRVGVKSTLTIYPGADHSLAGLHDMILADVLIKFAGLMGIPPPVTVTAPS
jgi:dienelactone hydrolase